VQGVHAKRTCFQVCKLRRLSAEHARWAPEVFWKRKRIDPLETEQDERSEEIAQGVCKSGLITSPKAQEG
jgi:hypothetical protein